MSTGKTKYNYYLISTLFPSLYFENVEEKFSNGSVKTFDFKNSADIKKVVKLINAKTTSPSTENVFIFYDLYSLKLIKEDILNVQVRRHIVLHDETFVDEIPDSPGEWGELSYVDTFIVPTFSQKFKISQIISSEAHVLMQKSIVDMEAKDTEVNPLIIVNSQTTVDDIFDVIEQIRRPIDSDNPIVHTIINSDMTRATMDNVDKLYTRFNRVTNLTFQKIPNASKWVKTVRENPVLYSPRNSLASIKEISSKDFYKGDFKEEDYIFQKRIIAPLPIPDDKRTVLKMEIINLILQEIGFKSLRYSDNPNLCIPSKNQGSLVNRMNIHRKVCKLLTNGGDYEFPGKFI